MSKQPAKKSKNKGPFFLILSLLIVILFLLVSFNLNTFLKEDRILGASEIQPFDEVSFWKDFVSVNENYLDGWVELAKLEAKAGKTKEVREILTKIEEIDPNSQKLLDLKNSL